MDKNTNENNKNIE